jgi:hypothetical protein
MPHPFAYASFLSLALLAVACGPGKAEPTTTDEPSTGTSTTAATTDDAPTTTTGTTTTGAPEDEPFGFVCLRLLKADSADTDPFVGTTQIQVTLKYDACLTDYYLERHPEQMLGADEGAAIVEAWRERLCHELVDDSLVACEVESLASFDQVIVDGGSQMTITYEIGDPAQIDGRLVLWGPGPVAATAACPMGQLPTVRPTLPSDVVGRNAEGLVVWQMQSWDFSDTQFRHDAAGCIEASVVAEM